MREVCRKERSYLPLEAFRGPSAMVDDLGEKAVRTFLSSGTTSSDRSRSRFSAEGLAAYRSGSLTAFLHLLKKESDGVEEIAQGISLIPPVAEWPDSSLAQMVAWIGEEMPVVYANNATLAAAISAAGDKPIFVFGTAFHFVHLIDSGFVKKLPEGSLIVETGGTKGKSREISREDLYAELARIFEINEHRIVSEYGMCELASQAYGRDKLRFPNWVTVSVLTGPGAVESYGRGALIVDDPQRLDVHHPIRTEDLVELDEDGSFKLLGRLDSAPLKGCSLLAEQIAAENPLRAESTKPQAVVGNETRARLLLDYFDHFLADPLVHKALAREFGSDAAATAALEDLAVSAPGSVDEWLAATHERVTAKHWLLILPENHSLVGIYPLALGFVLGLDLTVRIPRRFEPKTSFLQIFLDGLAELPGARIGTVPATFRVGESTVEEGGVLVFGSDETVEKIRQLVPGKIVQGFGNKVAYTTFSADDLAPLARDAFGLAQRGCLSTRLAVIADETVDEAKLADDLAAASAAFWDSSLDWRVRVGLDGAVLQLENQGFTVRAPENDATPVIATKVLQSQDELTPELARASISRHPFVLPVLILRDRVEPHFVKTALGEVSLTKSRHEPLSFREVGEANRPIWDGSHEARTLFAPH